MPSDSISKNVAAAHRLEPRASPVLTEEFPSIVEPKTCRYPTVAPSSVSTTVLACLGVIAMLWWGQRFLVPVVAGLMLSMLIAPCVIALQRVLRNRTASVLFSLACFLALGGMAFYAFGGQIARMADRSPEMIRMLAVRLAQSEPDADSMLRRSKDALQQLERAAQSVAEGTAPRSQRSARGIPPAAGTPSLRDGATVVLRETAVNGSTVVMKFASDMSIIMFVAFFVLSGGPVLSSRFLDLWGHSPPSRARAERTLLESARQIRLYAGVLIVTNAVIGMVVWLAFEVSGLPDAAMWGVTAAVLHVVPYLGMALLTGLGAAETFLVHGTLTASVLMSAFLIILSTLVGTVMTAWLQSRAAKMNAAAVFIGLMFWGALWGVWGLFLGPALVVVMKVIAQNSRSSFRLAKLMAG